MGRKETRVKYAIVEMLSLPPEACFITFKQSVREDRRESVCIIYSESEEAIEQLRENANIIKNLIFEITKTYPSLLFDLVSNLSEHNSSYQLMRRKHILN